MKIVIAGGTGFLGRLLARELSRRGDEVVVLSRRYKSRRVVPGRLLGAGFRFDLPTWPEAARDLVARSRAAA